MGIETAVLASLAIGASVYQSQQQKKAAESAQKAQEQADLEARRIAASKKPMEESATLKTNTSDANPLGTLGLVVEPNTTQRKTTNLGTTANTTGLGFGS